MGGGREGGGRSLEGGGRAVEANHLPSLPQRHFAFFPTLVVPPIFHQLEGGGRGRWKPHVSMIRVRCFEGGPSLTILMMPLANSRDIASSSCFLLTFAFLV